MVHSPAKRFLSPSPFLNVTVKHLTPSRYPCIGASRTRDPDRFPGEPQDGFLDRSLNGGAGTLLLPPLESSSIIVDGECKSFHGRMKSFRKNNALVARGFDRIKCFIPAFLKTGSRFGTMNLDLVSLFSFRMVIRNPEQKPIVVCDERPSPNITQYESKTSIDRSVGVDCFGRCSPRFPPWLTGGRIDSPARRKGSAGTKLIRKENGLNRWGT